MLKFGVSPVNTRRYRQLLWSILLLFFSISFFDLWFLDTFVLIPLFSFTTILAVRTFPLSNFFRHCLQILGLLALVLGMVGDLNHEHPFNQACALGSLVLFICFLGAAVIFLSLHLIHVNHVNADVVIGGVSVYLLIGIVWTLLYQVVFQFSPDAFLDLEALPTDPRFSLLYFSFTTLTTLGYGDITPTSSVSMGLTNMEAIIGQLYPAVFIARLVSLYSLEDKTDS
ncbi:potassium channel family protein [Synechocystis sp. LKSZ1]|uniref:potassium channel family protein n=1 Tax=Synechocystis sp. LKSZ1 TaxID=3144951 RepID=UPI00336BCC9E